MKKTLYILYLFTLINFLLGEQMIVVGEVFTESWWPYCPDARAGISDLADAQPNFIPLIFQGDTQYASPGYASRFNQYGGSGLPLAQFGGYLSVSGGGGNMYNTYLSRYNTVSNVNSPLSLQLSSDIIGNQIIMEANVEVTGNVTSSNNKVVFILTSYQDEDYFCSVISYDYSTFNLSSIGESDIFEMSVEIDPDWDINQINFVGLIQSFNDNHILQASSMSVPLNNLLIMDTQIEGANDQESGDGDGVANPGENIDLALNILNESMELAPSNSEIIITSNTPGIEILNSTQSYTDLIDSGNSQTVYFPISISDDIELGVAEFEIELNCSYTDNYSNNLTFSKSYERSLEVNLYQSGFPYITNSQVISAAAVADIDLDNSKEVIIGDYLGNLHVIDEFGNSKPGFPYDMNDQIWGSPAVADIDNDGDIEIIATSKNKRLCIINSDGSEQYQYNTGQVLLGTPVLGDIDGDTDLEIIFGGYDSNRKLYAINPDGSDVDGFPIIIDEKMRAGVAVADFNLNGKVDIVFGTDDEHIYLIFDDGTIAPGFPFVGDSDFRSEPAILEYNGQKMIIMGSKDGTLYSINENAELMFSIETSDDIMASPSILSIGGYEPMIFFGNNDGEVHAIYTDGSYVEGWPITFSESIVSSPVFSDFDSDFNPEIIFTTGDGDLHIINLDGSYYSSSPFSYAFPYSSSLIIHDLDYDGDLEVFSGTADGINVFDIKESGINHGYWDTFKANLHRDSFYSNLLIGDVNVDSNVDILDIIVIVSYILGNNDSINFDYADINYDGAIDISDIILILNYILID